MDPIGMVWMRLTRAAGASTSRFQMLPRCFRAPRHPEPVLVTTSTRSETLALSSELGRSRIRCSGDMA